MHPDLLRLIDSLDDPAPAARAAAAEAIGQWEAANPPAEGIEHALPLLAAALREDPAREVRWSAAYALGALGRPLAVPALVDACQQADGDSGLRLVIVKALGKIGDARAAPLLLDIHHTATSACLRAASARALARLRPDAETLALLHGYLSADFAAVKAADTARRTVDERSLPGLLAVIGLPAGPSLALHWAAVNALAEIGAPAVPGLLTILSTSPDSGVRWAAGEALGYIGTPAVPGLGDLLAHPRAEVRLIAAYALVFCGDARTLPGLLAAVEDADPLVGLMALKAVRRIGGPETAAVVRGARLPAEAARAWALAGLEQKGR